MSHQWGVGEARMQTYYLTNLTLFLLFGINIMSKRNILSCIKLGSANSMILCTVECQ